METTLDFEKPISDLEAMVEKFKRLTVEKKGDFTEQIAVLEKRVNEQRAQIFQNLTPWQIVQIARYKDRPVLQDYIALIFNEFLELHGDRRYGDDRALIGGFATIEGRKILLIGHNKGKNTRENIERNFGQARPDGYRKALRLMHLAQKYSLPVVTLIDTQGAFPGLDAEERGQHEAIARNLVEMSRLRVPIVCVITGEGGSGGAIGIGVGDRILMMQYAIYSVISPEGCAAILWRDAGKAPEAAQALKLTAPELLRLGVVDEIVSEPLGGAHRDHSQAAAYLRAAIVKNLDDLCEQPIESLLKKRFEKISAIGIFERIGKESHEALEKGNSGEQTS